jgi:hypothetical protein
LQAFPWDHAPRYLLRDRDSIYGEKFCETAKWMGIREVLTALRSPWQDAYAERLIGSIDGSVWTTSLSSVRLGCARPGLILGATDMEYRSLR